MHLIIYNNIIHFIFIFLTKKYQILLYYTFSIFCRKKYKYMGFFYSCLKILFYFIFKFSCKYIEKSFFKNIIDEF